MAQWLSGSVGYGSKNKNMEKACYIGTCLMKNIFCLSAKVIDLAHTTLGQFAGGWDDRPTIRVGWSEGRHAPNIVVIVCRLCSLALVTSSRIQTSVGRPAPRQHLHPMPGNQRQPPPEHAEHDVLHVGVRIHPACYWPSTLLIVQKFRVLWVNVALYVRISTPPVEDGDAAVKSKCNEQQQQCQQQTFTNDRTEKEAEVLNMTTTNNLPTADCRPETTNGLLGYSQLLLLLLQLLLLQLLLLMVVVVLLLTQDLIVCQAVWLVLVLNINEIVADDQL
ncbi:unnamed protein product [Ceratitis capitata]|uniref:(Mediterranean fruit fly) hypothetical protein n=1 Tax=Ceratitis capitata TaxID=7213 RepID=A0A811UJA0_CERCA|nr:unnamed protein product [Ceratitis capitata]